MEDSTLVQSSFSATINAPIEKVDIPSWCFTLPESEYQACSPAHYSAGSTTAPDGRRMSINVEVLGGSMIVQHYVEEIGQPDHLRLVSTSDVFTPTGRTKIGVIWDLAVRKIDDKTCEFTNTVQSCATPELMDFLGKQGIPLEVFRGARKPISEAHNRQETPLFARSIERHALRQVEIDRRKHAHLTYEKEITGLVVIDPYNDFISEGGKVWDRLKGVAEANQCIPHMLQVLDAARKADIRVFYATASSISPWRLRVLEVHCADPEGSMVAKDLRIRDMGRRDPP